MLFEVKGKLSNKYLDECSAKESHSKKSNKKSLMFSNDDARIITSGKVYRQLFESEVQLINALQKVKYTMTKTNVKTEDSLKNVKKVFFPSINGPHEDNIEEAVNKEVSTLPENLIATKAKSELIFKLMESRKLKFNKQFEELQQTVGVINKDINSTISDLCEKTAKESTLNRQNIESDFTIFDTNSPKDLSWEQFESMERKVKEHFTLQISLIDVLYQELLRSEESRVILIRKEISTSATKLERIGHLAPPDVHRIINNILVDTDDSILHNKEIYCDLRTKLTLSEIEENRKRQIRLKNEVASWRGTISDFYLCDFKAKIQKEESKSVDTIRDLLKELDGLVSRLSSDISGVFDHIIGNFDPEQYNGSFLNEINDRILCVITEFDKGSDSFVKSAYKEVECVNRKYLQDMDDVKKFLLKIRIFEREEECTKAVEGFCWPFLGSLQKSFEEHLDSIELMIEERCDKLKSQSVKLDQYLSSLLNLWEEHKESLNKAEESIFLKLSSSRESHQQQNLSVENELNLMIDRMRQESNEHGLKDSLSKCLVQLDKIKASYVQFYNQQSHIVKRYPSAAEVEVNVFEEKLIKFFANDQVTEETPDEFEGNTKNLEKGPFWSNLEALNISNERLESLKEKISQCYTDFMKRWLKSVSSNTLKIISAKVEELDSELKLRYHLHEPRYQRIEYDIHNVRSAELVIHAERVQRQCRLIENSLDNIRQEYLKLDETQRLKQEDFRDKLVSDELVYMTVTNHSKLMNIKVMLEERNNQYMSNLRTSLRTFRQNIETSLQSLRQSNAEFVRSFRLFSAGGNFCPGEIDDFNKKIERVNIKVEETESEIMSSLEMVEKLHQDHVLQLKNAFEEKFKYHIVDITFVETINRAMSNIQLSIKTEVSNSNSQSQFIYEKISMLESNLKDVLEHGSDSGDVIDRELLKSILAIFGCINDRSIYLDCMKTQSFQKEQPKLEDGKEDISGNIKVQFIPLTVISKGGRQPNEDAGIRSVKNMLKSQKNFINEQNVESPNNATVSDYPKNEGVSGDSPTKRATTRSSSTNSEVASNRKGANEKSKLVNKNQRLEKKYQAFGEEDSEEGFTFLKKIKLYCREILNGILYSAELYYRNKGVRKVTQPTLQENFEQAAEDNITKLKYYFKQAKEYHDECLREFNAQLRTLEGVLCMFPTIVYGNILKRVISECTNEMSDLNKIHSEDFLKISTKKKSNYNELRPSLSQPSKEAELKAVLSLQESVFLDETGQIDLQFLSNRKIVVSSGKRFTEVTANVTEQLLLLMDNLLTTDDVYNADMKPRFIDTKELIRKQAKAMVEDNRESSMTSKPTKKTWVFSDLDDILQVDNQVKDSSESRCLITAKYTSCHVQTIKEREDSVKKFKSFFFEKLSDIEKTKKKRIEETNNYQSFWKQSVKQLLDMNKI